MTIEKPVVITRPARRSGTPPAQFAFTRQQLLGGDDFASAYRQAAWQAFESLPMPTTRDEPWRRTSLDGLRAETFVLPGDGVQLPSPPADLLQPLTDTQHGGEIILTATGSQVQLAPELHEQGVVFSDLVTAWRDHPVLLERVLGSLVKPGEGRFAALAAMARTGILLYIPKGVRVEQPLHSLLWGPGGGLAYLSHLVVVLEEGASAIYVHEAASPSEAGAQTLHAGMVEIHVGANAHLQFVELQSWGEHVWNFSHERARVEQDGTLDWIFGAVGGHLTKNFSDLDLAGRGATGRMSGFYFTDHDQHMDHDTQQNHLAPSTTSDLLFKGALVGESRSVWQGMIYVAPGAPRTDGYQANRNLVLSRQARADSIPGLEILTDDVRCTHGATVGRIDADQVFYLTSRGIPPLEAERLIVEGFFDSIMQRIPFEGVRSRFQAAITHKMESYTGLV